MSTGRLCIIPARGGSKRLPRKNIFDFLGKPMIAYSIDAAIGAKVFDRIVVSTEDAEIADIARSFGADVELRDPNLATDRARVVDVCLDLLDREAAAGRAFPQFACLYPAAPLRNADDVRTTVEMLSAPDSDGPDACHFTMAVTTYPLPPHQALKCEVGGRLAPMWPDIVNMRESDIPQLVVDNGSTYATTVAHFRKARTFYGPGLRGHVMPYGRSTDINHADDIDLAKHFAGIYWRKRSQA
jgi:pseudaminic acid cytidylyltransferase